MASSLLKVIGTYREEIENKERKSVYRSSIPDVTTLHRDPIIELYVKRTCWYFYN